MSDDRFTYIHLRSEVSLWSYADDQVNWSLEDLDDRVDQSAWDMIPPYQNEDDEGILPSHSHPSYPFGNPYDPNQVTLQVPQLARVVNQPLAVGTALLLNSSNNDPNQAYWPELATERLLRRPGLRWPNSGDELYPEIPGVDPADRQQEAPDPAQPHYSSTADPADGPQAQMGTPATGYYRPARPPTDEETEEFDSDEDQSFDSSALVG